MKLLKLRGELGNRFVTANSDDGQTSYLLTFLDRGSASLDFNMSSEVDMGCMWRSEPIKGHSSIRIRSGSVGFLMVISDLELATTLKNCNESKIISRWIREETGQQLNSYPRLVQDLQFYFSALSDEQSHVYPASESLSQAWLLSILISVWRTLHPMSSAHDSEITHSEPRIVRFRSLLELHFRERWKVNDYAKALSLTADTLHELCRRHLNKPPSQLIQERTLNAAIQLLTESNNTVNQVADAIGFQSSAHFCTYFRKVMGQTPRQFRINHRSSATGSAGYSDWP